MCIPILNTAEIKPEDIYKQIDFPLSVNVSRIEWHIIQKLRMIVSNKYGTLTAKVEAGKVVDLLPTPSVSKDELRELQI